MMHFRFVLGSIFCALFLFAWSAPTARSAYVISELVSGSSIGTNVSVECRPAINGAGGVAFEASSAAGEGMYVTLNGFLTPIVAIDSSWRFNGRMSLNDSGEAAFAATSPVNIGVFKGSGGTIATIAISSGAYANLGSIPQGYSGTPSINAAGEVLYSAANNGFFNAGGDNTWIVQGNGVTEATVQHRATLVSTDSDPVTSRGGAAIAYTWAQEGAGEYSLYRVYAGNTTSITPSALGINLYDISVNDSGVMALISGIGNPLGTVVRRWHGDQLTTFAGGNPTEFTGFSDVSINNSGEIVFFGQGSQFAGIYNGPDRVLNKIVEVGDELAGSTITQMKFGRHGLNDQGQVAFWAKLADGTDGIFVATIPEPSAIILIAIACGCLSGRAWGRRR